MQVIQLSLEALTKVLSQQMYVASMANMDTAHRCLKAASCPTRFSHSHLFFRIWMWPLTLKTLRKDAWTRTRVVSEPDPREKKKKFGI